MKSSLALVFVLAATFGARAQAQHAPRRQQPQPRTAARAMTTPAPVTTTGQTLPIRRVILYSNGVAYIERRGTVSGRAEVNLSFKQSQVDDVLKSMVVLDLGRGRIGAVSYNSSAPPSARMADIPFSVSPETRGGGGLAGVLAQLQGARVLVTTAAGRTAAGSVLTVEERRSQPDPAKPPAVTHYLVIASDGGELASFDLAEVRAVRLTDEGARRDVGEFAAAAASARRRDAKTITVTSDGEGAREMVVSYTIAAPIWKTTYRVVLDAEGKPFFQGWAVVDNVSEEDWEAVRLSLVSGTPVSFIHPIQKPFYRYRPVVPMPEDLQLSPQVYEPETGEAGGNSVTGRVEDPAGAFIPGAQVTVTNEATGKAYTATSDDAGNFRTPFVPSGTYTVRTDLNGFKTNVITGLRVGPVRPASVAVRLEVAGVSETVTVTAADSAADFRVSSGLSNSVNNLLLVPGERGRSAGKDEDEVVSVAEAMTGGNSGVEAEAEGSEVGDLFEYQIANPVTVRRDRSALIPIVQTRMEGSRVSVYRETQRRTRPMAGMLLKNTTQLTLEGGALTVLDGDAYAGEALMERLKPAEQRLVSFALDLGTLVTVRQEESDSPVFLVRIANGALYANYHNRQKKVYTLANQTDKARTVYVEHPVRQGWELDDRETPRPEGKSASFYRFRVELAPRSTEEVRVIERETAVETYALSDLTPDLIQIFVTRRYIDDATRQRLREILDLKARLASANTRVQQIEQEIGAIAADQKRLRDNIEALNKTPEARQLIARYVQKADQQETRLEQLAREKQAALEERQSLQSQLNNALRSLSLERNLT